MTSSAAFAYYEPSDPTSMTPNSAPVLEVKHLAKSFGGVVAIQDMHLEVRAGEVHCLMGENGAGKSTLLRTLAGMLQPDAGEIYIRGERRQFASPRDAIAHGVAMIHQELLPFPDLTVAENVLIGREPGAACPGAVNHRRMQTQARSLLETVGAAISPRALMRDLSVSETQMVEIAKAVAREASIIIMDEPTSSISHHETEALFRLIGDLRARGTAVIYVSHKMDEIFRIGDRVTVLRDGRYIATEAVAALDESKLISLMVGRTLTATRRTSALSPAESPGATAGPDRGEIALEVRGLGRTGKFSDVSFAVRRGEVLGMAGLMGAGRTDVVSAIYGLAPADTGTVHIRGNPVRITRPRDAMRHGIGFVSEDRKLLGLNLGASIQHNVTAGHLSRCCRFGVVNHRREAAIADAAIREYRIRAQSRHQPVGLLSGGNQQKVVIAKVLYGEPEILLLDEPTRGIDIGAKQEIYALIAEWARAGRAIILVSSELPELLALSDRILVMRAGRISIELKPDRFSQEEILRHAMPA